MKVIIDNPYKDIITNKIENELLNYVIKEGYIERFNYNDEISIYFDINEINYKDNIFDISINDYLKFDDEENKYCPLCGEQLIKDSINYYEGKHIDGCKDQDLD